MPDEVWKRSPQVGVAPRACPVCKTEFLPYRDFQRACSRKCRDQLGPANDSSHAREVRFTCVECKKEAVTVSTTGAGQFRYCQDCKVIARRRRQERKNAARRDHPDARSRNLASLLRARYGLTVEQYEAKLREQDGRCALCGNPPAPNGVRASSRLHVDHDHTTGAIRSLLCNNCNRGIGYLKDDPALLRAAADYIERHRKE